MSEQINHENEPDPAKTSSAPRWMKIALVLSLSLNLLIVGAIAGAALSGGGKWHGPPGKPRGGAEANLITDALPEADRRDLRRTLMRAMRSDHERREALRSEMAALADVMRAPDFTPEALEEQLILIQQQMMGRLAVARGILVERLAGFDAAERASYAERLDEALQKNKK